MNCERCLSAESRNHAGLALCDPCYGVIATHVRESDEDARELGTSPPGLLPNFAGLDPALQSIVARARDTLRLGAASESTLVEMAIRAFGVGFERGTHSPACGCRQCPECEAWVHGSWCDLCEVTIQ